MNCKLSNNISLVQADGSSVGCNGQDMTMAGGLISPVYIYNISDVDGLKFENDRRSDDSLIVDTVITDEPFYSIDFTNGNYTEEYEDGKWSHTLTLDVGNITNLYENLLAEGVNGKYLVAFKTAGDDDFRMFGWKFGASLDYSMSIAEDSQGYTITLSDESEYPLFSVYRDNFQVKDKVYSPIFSPLYSTAYCEQSEGGNNGYAVAMYVVKVNAAGQALDEDNKLCQWSGKKQDAYKLNVVTSDGGYRIIGEYTSSAIFDGHPVRVFDPNICPADVHGSITLNGSSALTLNLNSTTVSSAITIQSDYSWVMLSSPNYVTVSPSDGNAGSTTVHIHHNGYGGVDSIAFQNRKTKERVILTVNVNIIRINDLYSYQNGTTNIIITPQVEGSTSGYSFTMSPIPASITKDSNGYLHISFNQSDNEQDFVITLTHGDDPNEVKTVNIVIIGNNNNPSWQLLSSFCEIS